MNDEHKKDWQSDAAYDGGGPYTQIESDCLKRVDVAFAKCHSDIRALFDKWITEVKV